MRKITIGLMCAVFAILGIFPGITQADEKAMNFKLVSMIEKMERIEVSQMKGVFIGAMQRMGLSLFDNGEIATTSCRGTFDTKKGWQGYSSMVFEDGSTLVLTWKGPTSQSRPEGGKYWNYTMSVEYLEGTGRFEGIKGKGTYTAKVPQWDEDYKTKGFGYYQFSGNYTLPSK